MVEDEGFDRQSLSKLKVTELRELCKEAGVLISGKKDDLIDRLLLSDDKPAGELYLDEEKGVEGEVVEAEVSLPEQPVSKEEINIDDAIDRLIAKAEGKDLPKPEPSVEEVTVAKPAKVDEEPEIIEAEILDAEIIPQEQLKSEPVSSKKQAEKAETESIVLDDDPWSSEIVDVKTSGKKSQSAAKPRSVDDEASITITLPSFDIVQKYWQQIAAIGMVILLVGGGVFYFLSAESSFQARQLNYGDSMGFTVTGGEIALDGDDMVRLLRDALPGTAIEEACNELNIGITGLGSISITKGDESDILHGLDSHLIGAVDAKDAYGRSHLTAEQILEHNLEIDLSGKTWRDTNVCGNLGWSMSGNDLVMTTKTYDELTENALLRSETDISFTDIEGFVSTAGIVTFGADGLGNIGSMGPLLAFPMAPIELHAFFGDTKLVEDFQSSDDDNWNSDWSWSVGKEYNDASHGMVYPISIVHDEIERCLGHARIDILVQNGKPWPVQQEVDILIDKDRSTGDCGFFASAASDAALPTGSLTIKMTMSKTTSASGSTPVAWQAIYAGRPGPGEDKPNSLTQKQWTTSMWDESEIRSFNLEEALSCLRASHPTRSITQAIESDGYIWQAIYSQPTRSPEWNLSWVRSDDSAGWALVRTNGESCSIIDEGAYAEDEVKWNRDAIPETHNMALLEGRILDSIRYPGLTELLDSNTQGWNVDAIYGYRLSVSEENELLSLLPGDFATGQVTVAGERTWVVGNREHTASFVMNAETGRMLGWIEIVGAAN